VPALGGPVGWMAVSAFGAVLVWVLVSPALWGWLPERLESRQAERSTLIAQRFLPDPGPADQDARIRAGIGVLTDAFLTPTRPGPGTGAGRPDTGVGRPDTGVGPEAEVTEYRQSWWSGLPLGEHGAAAAGPVTRVLPQTVTGVLSTVLGMILTLAVGLGAVQLWRTSRRQALAVFGWALGTAGWLVLQPSRQADQEIPLVALSCVLAAAAVPLVLAYLARLSQVSKEAMDARTSPDSLDFLGTKDPGTHRANP
jgi:hypothetical protein